MVGHPLRPLYSSVLCDVRDSDQKIEEGERRRNGREKVTRAHLAAAFIRDSQHGRFEHGEASGLLGTSWNKASFSLYYGREWQAIIYSLFALQFAMRLLDETPGSAEPRIGTSGPLLELIDVLFAVVHVFDANLKISHMGRREYFRKGLWNRSAALVRVVVLAEALYFALPLVLPYWDRRWTRPLLPALVLTRNRELRQLWDGIQQTLFPDLTEVLAVLVLTVIVFATALSRLLPDAFQDVPAALSAFAVLVTGDNFPDAFAETGVISLPFAFACLFVLAVVHVVLSIVLAVVVDSYGSQQREIVKKDRVKEQRGLVEAFHVMVAAGTGKTDLRGCGLSRQEWHSLMAEYDASRFSHGRNRNHCDWLYDMLNRDGGTAVPHPRYLISPSN
jgi:Ion transport protein